MRIARGVLHFSASDLAGHLACRHKTGLDEEVARGTRNAPAVYPDPLMDVLIERGRAHEAAYVASLGVAARDLVAVDPDAAPADAVAITAAAMKRGAAVIVQPSLAAGRWFGRADVLRRVSHASKLGAWSYEVIDTKLAAETRASTILQLCLYTELVAHLQGEPAEQFHVVTPPLTAGADFRTEAFRLADYAAYYRHVKERLATWTADETYPDPVAHCDSCRWWQNCDLRRRADDSLWLVAGLSRAQYKELRAAEIATLEGFARARKLPVLARGSQESLARVQLQAKQQLAGRTQGKPVHALLPFEDGRGLARLPAPAPGDLFFDIEGDRMSVAEGIEFLFGLAWTPAAHGQGDLTYRGWWATTTAEERVAFQQVVDFITDHLARHPRAHVYHYAPYEPSALKRLMGRHGTHEDELDVLLRGERFVDLCAVTRQALRASVERYSIKDLEQFYGYERKADLRAAGACLRAVRVALACGDAAAIDAGVRTQVEDYNREDCESARGLRDWLEQLRAEAVAGGAPIARPVLKDGAAAVTTDERKAEVAAVADRLLAAVPDERRTPAQQGRWLLAQMLEYHRREDKVFWWEHFRLAALSTEESLDEKVAIGGLTFVKTVAESKRGNPIDRYRYSDQEHEVEDGDSLTCAAPSGVKTKKSPTGRKAGAKVSADDDADTKPLSLGHVVAQSRATRTIDVQKTARAATVHPDVAFTHELIGPRPKPDALLRLGDLVASQGFRRDRAHAAASALLQRTPPRVELMRRPGEDVVALARRVVLQLDGDVLSIQGPPGTGKTYTAAQMICALVAAGRRVGVTATSHKVLRNLLDKVAAAALTAGQLMRCMHKVGADHEPITGSPIQDAKNNKEVVAALAAHVVDVVGGTSWLWAAPELAGVVDVLFVDEAGQMSLADTLAASLAARNLVLVGDPRQLDQPQQGSHPEGAEVSALGHLFGDATTIPDDAGIFLAETWRLAPAINAFTSELFYDGRLAARPGNAHQRLNGRTPFADGAGAALWFIPVNHTGNQSSSREEVDAVVAACDRLLQPSVTWTDARGASHPLRGADVLIVAPYNAHVELLKAALAPRGIRVGTVDKFQGQEAPVAIYSMATSTPDDAPRGMEFLYSANRLNVATSRARCASILVASPRLFEPECKTPRQMKLANAFCRYLELARAG